MLADHITAHLAPPHRQASLAAKEAQAAAQQQTIRQLEATVREQQADIRSALALVSGRPAAAAAAAADSDGDGAWLGDAAAMAAAVEPGSPYALGGWEGDAGSAGAAAELLPEPVGLQGLQGLPAYDPWAAADGLAGLGPDGELDGSASGDPELERLLGAATAAADAATAWAGGYRDTNFGGSTADALSGGSAGWSIPAGHAWAADAPSSPPRCGAVAAVAAASPAKRVPVSAPRSLQSSPGKAPAGGASIEDDIAGLESALRSALGAL